MRLRRLVPLLAALAAGASACSPTSRMADVQLFSFRNFQNEGRRNQFLDYVRAELER